MNLFELTRSDVKGLSALVAAMAAIAWPGMAAAAPAPRTDRVAVVVVAATDTDAAAAGDLSDILVATLSARPATVLVGRDEFVAALRDVAGSAGEDQIRHCVVDLLCLAKVGGAIGAKRIFAGRLARGMDGVTAVLTLTVVDPSLGRAIRESARSAANTDELIAAIPVLLDELLALDTKARLIIEASALDAMVSVDGRTVGTGARLELDVDPGPHTVIVSKTGFETFNLKLEVTAGEVRSVSAVLRPPAKPFYTRWWLWTGVVVLAGGAATTAYLLARRDPLRDADPFFRIGDPR